jgi:hypothetical protein
VFRFLYDLVSVGGGFQEAVRKRGGVSSIRCLAARRYSDIVMTIRIGSDENVNAWEYELRFSQDNPRRPIIKWERVARQLWQNNSGSRNEKARRKRHDEQKSIEKLLKIRKRRKKKTTNNSHCLIYMKMIKVHNVAGMQWSRR